MRTVLRLLIALNWSIAGCAGGQVIYGHHHLCGGICYDLAREDLARQHPELTQKFGTHEYREKEEPLVDDYRRRTEMMVRSGQIGWVMTTALGTVTALGLMAVFPKKAPQAAD
ncbi:MAG: hypothetical protein ABGY75_10110 [Gemmataceae bacterium]